MNTRVTSPVEIDERMNTSSLPSANAKVSSPDSSGNDVEACRDEEIRLVGTER